MVDVESGTITCPAGQVELIPGRRPKSATQVSFGSACASCALASSCTDSRQGRSIEVNPDEELLAPARAAQWTEAFRDRYASGPGSNARPPKSSTATPSCPGEVWSKADAWVKLRVSAINLDRLGRLGLVGA